MRKATIRTLPFTDTNRTLIPFPALDKDPENQLRSLREQIDAIDSELLGLMNRRLDVAKAVAAVKATLDEPAFYRPEREAQVLRRLHELNEGPLTDSGLESLFREIMSITRGSEAGLSVSILGPLGTYTEAAARQHFGSAVEIVDFPTIDEIFKSTETGNTHFSVVPVENSTEGGVTGTLDRMVSTTLTICGEINLKIHHNFMSNEGDLKDISKVYAHVQSLGQCKRWLEKHLPGVERVPVGSNADAARKAAGEPGTGAIAGDAAAERYGISILNHSIEDEPGNTTRFLVLSDRKTPPSGCDKTSVLLSAKSEPGALLHLLQPLLDEKIDMSKIESRPSRVGLWEYVFFIDFLGHSEEPHIARAMKKLEQEASLFKHLGSYPVSV